MSQVYYSLIPLCITFSIYRPFISRLDIIKYAVLGSASFITPFILQYNKYKWNSISTTKELQSGSILFSLSNQNNLQNSTPENYALLLIDALVFLIFSTCIVSICGLFTRWHFPITFIKPKSNTHISIFLRYGLSISFIILAIISRYAFDHKRSFGFAVIGFVWYISGPYFIQRNKSILVTTFTATLIPTLICDTTQLLTKITLPDWILFSLIVVLVCNSFDHLDAILNMYPQLVTLDFSQVQQPTSIIYWYCMFRLIMTLPSEDELDPEPIQDLETAIKCLGPASRSWKTMAALFPTNLRQDLCLLYAFFRTADDLIDDAPSQKEALKNLNLIRTFLQQVFFDKSIEWDKYQQELPSKDHVAVFRNFARISFYLCPQVMYEITNAWELDIYSKPLKTEQDLLDYASLISGTFGEICTFVIMYKTGHGNWGSKNSIKRNQDILSKARATGQCLQLVNIARDIIADSLDGRCYVPLEYMPHINTFQHLKIAKNPLELVGERQLKSFSLRILDLTDQISDKAQKGIDALPLEVQDSIRAAFEIYMAIGTTLRNDPGYPLRAKVPKSLQQWIAFRCLYGIFNRGPFINAIQYAFDEAITIYHHFFGSN